MQSTIRASEPGDAAGIRDVLRAAFQGDVEAKLVDELRADGDIVLSLVVSDPKDSIIGYIAFLRLSVAETPCIGLAPLAVAPQYQRCGIGKALIEQGMVTLKQRGEKLFFVLGQPDYYTRFGFDPQAAIAFTSDYSGPYFMAYRLEGAPASGAVRYPPAFARLD
jgi:putative acetyltransferase